MIRRGDFGYIKFSDNPKSLVMICCACGCIHYSDWDLCKED